MRKTLSLRVSSIAVPDSLFLDEDNLRGKTVKAGQIARAASIFGADRIYVYRDSTKNYDGEYEIAKEILQYAETPQYLRRRLIGRKSNLEYAGLLYPLRTPHHQTSARPLEGEVREGVLVVQNGKLSADVGSKELAAYEGSGQEGQRITVSVISANPLKVARSSRPDGTYWGYEVRRAPTLGRFLRSANFELVILTSRLGENIAPRWDEFSQRCRSSGSTLTCFGSPEYGIDYMLKQDKATVKDFPKAMYLNFFPFQNVATIRLEEAILGCLAIQNLASRL